MKSKLPAVKNTSDLKSLNKLQIIAGPCIKVGGKIYKCHCGKCK